MINNSTSEASAATIATFCRFALGPRIGAAHLPRIELEPLGQFVTSAGVHPAQSGQQVDHLPAAQVRPEIDVARYVCQPAVQLDRVVPGVAAEQGDQAGVRPQLTQQNPDGGRLSGSVRTEKAVHLIGFDRKGAGRRWP